jgi:hypothetical protein
VYHLKTGPKIGWLKTMSKPDTNMSVFFYVSSIWMFGFQMVTVFKCPDFKWLVFGYKMDNWHGFQVIRNRMATKIWNLKICLVFIILYFIISCLLHVKTQPLRKAALISAIYVLHRDLSFIFYYLLSLYGVHTLAASKRFKLVNNPVVTT